MDSKSHIKLSVVIVCYNNLEVLRDCLDSIEKYNDIGQSLEVIVVDNGTSNTTFDYVTNNYKNVKILKNENKGFGQGNNIGFIASSGEFILFLNPDTILIEPIFTFALKCFESEPKLGLFGLKLINASGKWNLSFNYIDKHGLIYAQLIKLFHKISYFSPDMMYVVGANLFMRRSVFSEIGMFDEEFFMYYEEPDIAKRIKKLGYSIKYFPTKRIIHLEGASSLPNQKMLKIKMDSYKKYCKKYSIDFEKEVKKETRRTYLKYLILKAIDQEKSKDYKLLLEEMSMYND